MNGGYFYGPLQPRASEKENNRGVLDKQGQQEGVGMKEGTLKRAMGGRADAQKDES